MKHHIILKIVTKLLIPLILLFGLYVQFHGDFSAGGGFQAGVIFAAGFILYNIVFGLDVGQSILSSNTVKSLMAIGVILYTIVGFLGILLGGNFLEYNDLSSTPMRGQLLGVFLVELGVGLTVSNVMVLVFYSFNDISVEKQ
ncbi:MAG: Na(+)/H(+) antiporter subunit B [Gammaproteobacteria bacterium]|nr:Na(+)/H(+) antiporter subunit B [Gammaproteobacteria bacterium]MBT3697414.1 Na(+)/H(+) antiporter subunit B [Gammaproteobacteria bacterium]MBT4462874.1 Na(+)/H(+) antiporter subunit B [Gammaproteobacteria bacterium]MBT6331761.1 Na(+)/H(+) antiporter subunit B [Gammaproteobacteria bacterium]MBT7323517.1 Na(+)/H(+) antiporter subunit B [Gammaproteobacteria bacterium]